MATTEEITRERFASWTKRMSEQHSTPMLLLGVGHDHTSGQLVVLVPEEVTNADVRRLLLYALRKLPS